MATKPSSRLTRKYYLLLIAAGILIIASLTTSGLPDKLRRLAVITEPDLLSPADGSSQPGDISSIQLTPSSFLMETGANSDSLMVFSLRDGLYRHLFAYNPISLPITRLTNTPWDDIDPTLNPTGELLAYSSRQNGYWDLFILNLTTSVQVRITDTPTYDGSPSWSPDGQWLVYESYQNSNLDIFIQSTQDASIPPIVLADDPSADHSPAWSPRGRQIAFVSTRTGDSDIWLARLEGEGERFINISHTPHLQEDHPAWSPDGRYLAWSSNYNGEDVIYIWDSETPTNEPQLLGAGNYSVWSPDGQSIATEFLDANHTYLTGYRFGSSTISFPVINLPGSLNGMDWKQVSSISNLQLDVKYRSLQNTPQSMPTNDFTQARPTSTYVDIVKLNGVSAPYPYLSDFVDETFHDARQGIGKISGWDLLADLEKAYSPITYPVSPGISEDWHYTGRAISFNSAALQSNAIVAMKEEISGFTYWRIFLKTRFQDGSQGEPLHQIPWDFNARYSGDPIAYEQGGAVGKLLTGYWIDLTDLLLSYNWHRLPADRSWRTYFPASHFNEFVITDGLSWAEAMSQLYPLEALQTPTFVPTYTPTPTRTIAPQISITPQPSTTITSIPTFNPTWTPLPGTPTP